MLKAFRRLLFLSIILSFIISCEKSEEPFPYRPSHPNTIIKLPEAENGPLKTIALDLTPGIVSIKVLEVRRDAVSPGDLNTTLVVKIKNQNALISEPTSGVVKELPRNLYTADPSNPFDGQYWTVTFDPGEFIEFIKINLNPSDLITAGRVGLGFQLAETPGALINDERSQLGVELGAKNIYDGIYEITGAALREGDPALSGVFGPYERTLVTASANSVQWEGQVLWANGSNSALPPGYEPQVTVSPATNLITQLRSPNGLINLTNPVVRTDILNGTQHRYDPATRTLYFEFTYTTPTNRLFSFRARYLRPR